MQLFEATLSLVTLVILAFVLLVPVFFRWRERMTLLQLVGTSAEAGRPLSAEAIQALRGGRLPSASRDLRRGAMLMAFGIGLFLLALCAVFVFNAGSVGATVIGALGIIPACIGGAFLFLAYSERKLVKG
jgi:hypothetical protein